MLRKVRTSLHSSSKLSFQKGKQSLSASLKFFEHIFIFIWSEEKPEYTSTEVAEREVLSHKLCLKALSNAAGVLRSSSRMAEQDLVLAELLRVWVHTSLPKMPCKRLVPVQNTRAWPGELGAPVLCHKWVSTYTTSPTAVHSSLSCCCLEVQAET